ncbi:hypothetical protein BGZ82_010204 [Podila clonocystis]|nr:hypothetical protein BGZ82_010204 [Podila clonocystis]
MAMDDVKQEPSSTRDKQEQESSVKKRPRIVYATHPDPQEPTSTVNVAPIVLGMAGINLKEPLSEKGKGVAVEETSAKTLADAMAGIRIQGEHASRSRKPKMAQQEPKQRDLPIKKEVTPSPSNSAARTKDTSLNLASNAKAVGLHWYYEVFVEEEGEAFAQLFDILQRRNDKDETLINRWITELPAGGAEWKAKLPIALEELRLEQFWLQRDKQAYLSDPEARKNVRQAVLQTLKGTIMNQQMDWLRISMDFMAANTGLGQLYASWNRPSWGWEILTPLQAVRRQVMKQRFDQFMADEDERDEAYWRNKAEAKKEAEREAVLRKQIDDEIKWRVKAAEDRFKRQLKDAEDRFKRQVKDAEDRARRQLRDANDRAQRRVQDAENLARRARLVESGTIVEPRSERTLDQFARLKQAQSNDALKEPQHAEMGRQATGSSER